MSKPCVWCGKQPEDHENPGWYEPPMETLVDFGSITIPEWKPSMVPYQDMYEPDFSDVTPRTFRQRMSRVFNDTAQWRLIALTADIVVLGIFLGNWKLVTAAGALLFGIKTALFILWRTWREAQLED